jgi:lipoprotein-releasing system permease protein
MKLEYFIAKRYLFSKRKISFITLISVISILGVLVGVAALIVVLSVFNGFQNKATSILIGFDPHLRIEPANGNSIKDYESVLNKIKSSGIKNIAPYTLNKGMVANSIQNKVVYVKGIDEKLNGEVSGLKDYIKLGKLSLADSGRSGGVVLGLTLADRLNATTGDTVTLISPSGLESSLTQFVDPVNKQFVIRGIYSTNNREFDSKYAFISLSSSDYLFKTGNNVSGLEIRLDNINDAESYKKDLEKSLGPEYNILTWYDINKDLFSAFKIERIVAFIILSIIIIVACFNILGSLTMTVIEKKRDIGVLKAMGATNKMITRIFMVEGVAVGIIGMLSGTLIGLGITLAQIHYKFYHLDNSVYQIDSLPVMLKTEDFIFVPLAAFILCFLASLYPARKAARLNPVESIRWE